VISYIRSVQVKAPAQPAGNAATAKNFLWQRSLLHVPHDSGKGRAARDPTSAPPVSARSTEYLVESNAQSSRRLAQGISEAMKEFSQEYDTRHGGHRGRNEIHGSGAERRPFPRCK